VIHVFWPGDIAFTVITSYITGDTATASDVPLTLALENI